MVPGTRRVPTFPICGQEVLHRVIQEITMSSNPPEPTVEEKLKSIAVEHLFLGEDQIASLNRSSKLWEDLGADSLDQVELVMAVEEEFNVEITDEEGEKVKTFGDAVDLVTAKTR